MATHVSFLEYDDSDGESSDDCMLDNKRKRNELVDTTQTADKCTRYDSAAFNRSARQETRSQVVPDNYESSASTNNATKNTYNGTHYMEIVSVTPQTLKKTVEVTNSLLSVASLKFTPDGMKIIAMDASKVSVVSSWFYKTAFSVHHVPEELEFGIDMSQFAKLLMPCARANSVKFFVEAEEKKVLYVHFTLPGMVIKQKIMDIEIDRELIPELLNGEYAGFIKMASVDFQNIIKDLSMISDVVLIGTNFKTLKFFTKGESSEICIEMSPVDEKSKHTEHETKKKQNYGGIIWVEDTQTEDSEDFNLYEKYSLRYLSHVVKATPLCPSITIFFGQKLPLMVKYSAGNEGEVSYGISHIINQDE